MHSGKVVGGVVGSKIPHYSVFGLVAQASMAHSNIASHQGYGRDCRIDGVHRSPHEDPDVPRDDRHPRESEFSLTSKLHFFCQVGGFTYEPRGVVQLPKVFFSLKNVSRCLTFGNVSVAESSLLVRLEQCQHSGWWEGRTHRRRPESPSRIRSLPTILLLVPPRIQRGRELFNWELDYCPQMPRLSRSKEFSMFDHSSCRD